MSRYHTRLTYQVWNSYLLMRIEKNISYLQALLKILRPSFHQASLGSKANLSGKSFAVALKYISMQKMALHFSFILLYFFKKAIAERLAEKSLKLLLLKLILFIQKLNEMLILFAYHQVRA